MFILYVSLEGEGWPENIKMEVIHSFKLFYIVLLVVIFVVYFGAQNLQKFFEQKTIFLESKIKGKMHEHYPHKIKYSYFSNKIGTETVVLLAMHFV